MRINVTHFWRKTSTALSLRPGFAAGDVVGLDPAWGLGGFLLTGRSVSTITRPLRGRL